MTITLIVSAAKALQDAYEEVVGRYEQGEATDQEEQTAWEAFAEICHTHRLCLGCLQESLGYSYCDDCRGVDR